MPSRQTTLRRLAFTAAGVAACAAAAAVTVTARAPTAGAGERLLLALGDAAGLVIRANGPAEVSLFPTPRLRAAGVSLARGGEPPFAVARELVGSLSLPALITGRIELAEITLDRPDIALDRAPYADALASLRDRPAAFAARAVRIVDGRLTMGGRVIDKVEAGVAWPRAGGPLAVSGYGRYAGRPVEATFQLADLSALARRERAPFRARIEGGGGRLLFDGEAIDRNGPKLVGEISVRAVSLGDTLGWLGMAGSARGGAGPGQPWSLSLAGRGALDGAGLSIANAELDLSGESFLGAGRITAASDGRPSVEATLDAGSIDLARYVAVLAPEITRADGGWSSAPIDLKGLGGWTLDLRVSAADVRLGRLTLGQTAATLAVAGGGLDLSLGEAEAYGGSLGGSLSLEPSDKGARMRLEGALSEVALDEALAEIVGAPAMSGALSAEASVASEGASMAAFVSGLSGRASARMTDGAIADIGRSRTLALAGLSRRMEITTADARFRIENGIARAEDVSVVGPAATVALTGTASLVERIVRLKGSVKPAQGRWALPVTLEGPLGAPRLRPDLDRRTPRGEARSGAADATTN